jgi:hypothetical protein
MCRAPWGGENGLAAVVIVNEFAAVVVINGLAAVSIVNGLAAVKPLQRKGFDGVKDMEIFGMLV